MSSKKIIFHFIVLLRYLISTSQHIIFLVQTLIYHGLICTSIGRKNLAQHGKSKHIKTGNMLKNLQLICKTLYHIGGSAYSLNVKSAQSSIHVICKIVIQMNSNSQDQIITPGTLKDSTVPKPKQISFRAILTMLVPYLKKKRENPTYIHGNHIEFEGEQ